MWTRRQFLQVAPGIPVGLHVIRTEATPPKRYGRLDVDAHRRHEAATGEHLRVYLDGVDVTNDCTEADDRDGWVRLLARDENGRLTFGFDAPMTVIRTGTVLIKPGPRELRK